MIYIMQNKSITIENDLGQIADMLLLNGTLTDCPGLVHGKMGIAVFFFHYAQYTGNADFGLYPPDTNLSDSFSTRISGRIFRVTHCRSQG